MTDVWLTYSQIIELGVSEATIWRKTSSGKWVSRRGKRRAGTGAPPKEVLLSSLPADIQLKWARLTESSQAAAALDNTPVEIDERDTKYGDTLAPSLDRLHQALKRFPADERGAWIAELNRLANVIERFLLINPRRVRNSEGKYEFVGEVISLSNQAACSDPIILAREPNRAEPRSPYTLDAWARAYQKEGLLAFIRKEPVEQNKAEDKRKATISEAAIEWVNQNWRNFRNPTHLYNAAQKRAKKENWKLPAKTWFFRRWKELPSIVITHHLAGAKAYVSKLAPYVPRDYSDLEPLQIICGDHSQRDVTVMLRSGDLVRPWLTTWQDMRTGLIWGWHLALTPSSYTAGMAYADGVMNFGAQPIARPDIQFYSYVFTDQGKDYKSRNWDGNVITVHKHAFKLDGGIEVLRVQRSVGFLDEMGIKHLLARGYNAKEKPVERYHRDISDWEENTFEEYCGRDAKNKPDAWRALYAKHAKLLRAHRVSESPVMDFDAYRTALAGFIMGYNASEHERSTLGGARIVPLDEFRRLYTTRYEIAEETLAMLLMKADKRKIRKNGVQCFQTHWFYFHPAMSEFKDCDVEIRFNDSDYSRLWVILPNGSICEASLVTPTSILTPNKQTLGLISEAAAHERKVIREANILNASMLRFESTEDRVAAQLEDQLENNEAIAVGAEDQPRVQSLRRFDGPKLRAVASPRAISVEQVSQIGFDESIFRATAPHGTVSEFDYEE